MNSPEENRRKQTESLFRAAGGYRNLKVYRLATLIYDVTVLFTERYIPSNSRTRDQMVQAARSGKQNICEGSIDAATSAKLELNLYNVAWGSLEELKADYIDFLRQNCEEIWQKEDLFAQRFIEARVLTRRQFRTFVEWAEEKLPPKPGRTLPSKSVIVANATILLIHASTFWLKRLIEEKAKTFLSEGGFSERMYRMRRSTKSL